jgi:hypothetical protein
MSKNKHLETLRRLEFLHAIFADAAKRGRKTVRIEPETFKDVADTIRKSIGIVEEAGK